MLRVLRHWLAAAIVLANAGAVTPAVAQSGTGGKYSPNDVVGCLVAVGELIRAGPIANAPALEPPAIIALAALYEHESVDIPQDVAQRYVALHDELWAAANALPETSRLDTLAQRVPSCGPVLTDIDTRHPERFHLEIGVTADPRTVKEEVLARRFCRLRPAVTPLTVKVKKDRDGREVEGPAVVCLVGRLNAELGPGLNLVPVLACDALRQ